MKFKELDNRKVSVIESEISEFWEKENILQSEQEHL